MKQRTEKDIWHGLNDFYLIETLRKQKPATLRQKDQLLIRSTILKESRVYKHVLSHQKLMVRFIKVQVQLTKKREKIIRKSGMKWFTRNQVEKIPKPILIERYINEKIQEQDF